MNEAQLLTQILNLPSVYGIRIAGECVADPGTVFAELTDGTRRFAIRLAEGHEVASTETNDGLNCEVPYGAIVLRDHFADRDGRFFQLRPDVFAFWSTGHMMVVNYNRRQPATLAPVAGGSNGDSPVDRVRDKISRGQLRKQPWVK